MTLNKKLIIGNVILVLSIAISVAFLFWWDDIKNGTQYGYVFIFIQSFIAGSPIPVPDPYMVVVFTMAPVLNPLLVGLVSALGVSLGQLTCFLLGRLGRNSFLLANVAGSGGKGRVSRLVSRMIGWAQKRGSLAVFFLSAVFNPIFTPFAITMGALHFQLLKFFILCLAGNAIKSLILAYAGYFGLGFILRWIGVLSKM